MAISAMAAPRLFDRLVALMLLAHVCRRIVPEFIFPLLRNDCAEGQSNLLEHLA